MSRGERKPTAKKSAAGKKGRKRQAKNEFRYNKTTKHPNYVFEEDGDKYHSIGLTHSLNTFGKKNMPLEKNPKAGENKKAYLRNGIVTEKKVNYSKNRIKNMEFSDDDMKNVKGKVRNYKKGVKKRRTTNAGKPATYV